MKRLLFICFYELKDFFAKIKDELIDLNYNVIHYPLFRYAYDSNDKMENYDEHLNDFIKENKPDIILWWFLDVPYSVFKSVRSNNPDIFLVMYNPDDALSMSAEMIDKIKVFDLIMVSTKEYFDLYNEHNKNVLFNPFGFDDTFFFPIDITKHPNIPDKFQADISLYSHNLNICKNTFPNQYIYQLDFLKNVQEYANTNERTFKIFGAKDISNYFPEEYHGDIEYFNLNKLYNFSKINIVLHPSAKIDTHVSENEIKVIGSGGLLLTDPIKNLSSFHKESCVFIDKDNYIEQIDNILENYNDHIEVKHNAHKLSKSFTWKEWVKKMHVQINRHFFDPQFYKELYSLDSVDNDTLWSHYMKNIKDIPFRFTVPLTFRHDTYAKHNDLKKPTPEQSYLHWFLNSKDKIYFSKEKKSSTAIQPDKFNTNFATLGLIFNTFNRIENYNTKDQGLDELFIIAQNNPYLKVQDALDLYFQIDE